MAQKITEETKIKLLCEKGMHSLYGILYTEKWKKPSIWEWDKRAVDEDFVEQMICQQEYGYRKFTGASGEKGADLRGFRMER